MKTEIVPRLKKQYADDYIDRLTFQNQRIGYEKNRRRDLNNKPIPLKIKPIAVSIFLKLLANYKR